MFPSSSYSIGTRTPRSAMSALSAAYSSAGSGSKSWNIGCTAVVMPSPLLRDAPGGRTPRPSGCSCVTFAPSSHVLAARSTAAAGGVCLAVPGTGTGWCTGRVRGSGTGTATTAASWRSATRRAAHRCSRRPPPHPVPFGHQLLDGGPVLPLDLGGDRGERGRGPVVQVARPPVVVACAFAPRVVAAHRQRARAPAGAIRAQGAAVVVGHVSGHRAPRTHHPPDRHGPASYPRIRPSASATRHNHLVTGCRRHQWWRCFIWSR